MYRYKRQIVGLSCHIVFHFFGNFMPYPVFQDCFEMAARTPMKISTKIKEKKFWFDCRCSEKNPLTKTKYIRKKHLKNNLILFWGQKPLDRNCFFVIKSKLYIFGLTSRSFVGICAAVLEISKQTQKMCLFFRIEVRGIYNNEVLIFFHETTAQ